MGAPYGGKSFKLMSIDVHTLENGKLTRSYHLEDWMGAVRQLSTRDPAMFFRSDPPPPRRTDTLGAIAAAGTNARSVPEQMPMFRGLIVNNLVKVARRHWNGRD